jgi:amiloride-sensitive sodium channel
LLLTLSVIGCAILFGFYAKDAYKKWRITPDILIRINQKNIKEIPAPAVSVRTPLFARDRLANSIEFSFKVKELQTTGKMFNITPTEASYLMANMHGCHPSFPIEVLSILPVRTETNVLKLINESALDTDEVLFGCSYRNIHVKCSTMFNRILTDRGFHYAFNMLGHKSIFNDDVISGDFDFYKRKTIRKSPFLNNENHNVVLDDDNEMVQWSLENGFVKDHDMDSIPITAQKIKPVRFLLSLNKSDAENYCVALFETFNFFMHLPNEMPTPLHQRNYVRFGDIKFMMLTAKMYSADDELRRIEPEARGCYFEGERKLKFFKSYTKMHCEFECMTNYTLKVCGCVKFSMPRDDYTKVCDDRRASCFFDVMNEFPNYDVAEKTSDSCNCLRTCTDIKYRVEYEEVSRIKNSRPPVFVKAEKSFEKG